MANGQLPWLTRLSQQDAPDLAWRTEGHEGETYKTIITEVMK